jgi:hypothetical protein
MSFNSSLHFFSRLHFTIVLSSTEISQISKSHQVISNHTDGELSKVWRCCCISPLDPPLTFLQQYSSFFRPTRIHRFIQYTPSFRFTPPSWTTTTTSKHGPILAHIGITSHTIIVNVIFGMLIWPKCILTIQSIEAYVGCITSAVGESLNVAGGVGGCTVDYR